jgi:nitrogen-specific signal transduction histidine kinase
MTTGDSRPPLPVTPPAPLATHFASSQRASPEELDRGIRAASNNPVIDALMHAMSGLLAVLNEQRQVLALNRGMLELLGVGDAAEVLGLRVGEAVKCVHAAEMSGGCGTSEFCSTCGQAIAQVTSLLENRPVERMCALAVHRDGGEASIYLRVRAVPFRFDGIRVLLLFLQDVSEEQHMAALGRVFLHDLRNTVTGLVGTSELLRRSLDAFDENIPLADDMVRLAGRVTREVELQRCLLQSSLHDYEPVREDWTASALVRELQTMCEYHPAAIRREIVFSPLRPDLVLNTDATVLLRVVYNMVINALEATAEGGVIRVWIEDQGEGVAFCVWNRAAIPAEIARRVFQRDFSTKQSLGRGLGTYSMKLLANGFSAAKSPSPVLHKTAPVSVSACPAAAHARRKGGWSAATRSPGRLLPARRSRNRNQASLTGDVELAEKSRREPPSAADP